MAGPTQPVGRWVRTGAKPCKPDNHENADHLYRAPAADATRCLFPSTTPAVTPAPNALTDVAPVLTTGSWTVRSYRQRAEDKTGDFAGLTFVFARNGALTATQNGRSFGGSWSSTPGGVTYYGSAPAVATVTLTFGNDKPVKTITKSWNLNAASTSEQLMLDNREPLDDEHLVLAR